VLTRLEKILKTARMAVNVCAAITPEETILIVTDINKEKIANALKKACQEVGAETIVSIMSPRDMHGNEPPKVVASAMKVADVILAPTTYSMTHTDAMVEALGSGSRAIVMRGITEDMMLQGAMTADYDQLRARSIGLSDLLRKSTQVHVTSKFGTDVELSIGGRPVFVLSGFATEAGTFAALPDGEVPVSPVEGSSNGLIVFDHTMDGIGLLDAPIRIRVENGRVVDIEDGEGAGALRKIIESSDEGASNIAEFAIGTNPKALLIGNMAEDKKKEGSVHIAIGDNHNLGGTVKSSIHLDGLIVKPNVEIDGRLIVENGVLRF
jgi:leucyl aminopeptidase (aminopeptidase T)